MTIAASEISASRLGSTANAAIYSMTSFLPLAGAQVYVAAFATATVLGSISGGPAGIAGNWELICSLDTQALGHSTRLWRVNIPAAPASLSVNVDYTGDNATGCCAMVFQVASQEGVYIRQSTVIVSLGVNPVMTFPNSVLTDNGYLVGYSSTSSPSNAQAPAGWTSQVASYITPTGVIGVAYRAGGETGNTFTYSSGAGVTGIGMFGVEIWGFGGVPGNQDQCGLSGCMY